jgi:hypothetical protein
MMLSIVEAYGRGLYAYASTTLGMTILLLFTNALVLHAAYKVPREF